MQESGNQNPANAKNGDKIKRQAFRSYDADTPIPKPTTELGFRGIRHKQTYDSVSRRKSRDN
jgi:hypothetical protein